MTGWLRKLRGTIGMGVTWAIGWAASGILIGVSSIVFPFLPWDRFFAIFDAPLPALAVPGFIGGLLFSAVLGVAGRRRRFEELSMPRFAIWGAAGGLLLALVPGAMVLAGLATISAGGRGVLELTVITAPFLMALGSASASGSLWLARKAQRSHGDLRGIGAAPRGDGDNAMPSADASPSLREGAPPMRPIERGAAPVPRDTSTTPHDDSRGS